jgi:hypothetical protein
MGVLNLTGVSVTQMCKQLRIPIASLVQAARLGGHAMLITCAFVGIPQNQGYRHHLRQGSILQQFHHAIC